MAFAPPPNVRQVEPGYTGTKRVMPPRYDTSQLRRTGPNSFVDSLGQVYDGKGRPMALGGSHGGQLVGGAAAAGGGGAANPFAGQAWNTFDPSKAPSLPGMGAVGMTYANAVDAYKRALAQFNRQRTGLMTQYGYTGDIDPATGVLKNTRVDPNNPYGEYQLNRRSNYLDFLGAQNDRLSRGLSSRGLGAQQLDSLRFGWGAKDTSTSNSLVNALADVDLGQQNAYADMTNSYWNALLSATQDAVGAGDFGYAPEDYAGGEDPGAAGPDAAPGAAGGPKRRIAGVNYGRGVYRDKKGNLVYKGLSTRQKAAAARIAANDRAHAPRGATKPKPKPKTKKRK